MRSVSIQYCHRAPHRFVLRALKNWILKYAALFLATLKCDTFGVSTPCMSVKKKKNDGIYIIIQFIAFDRVHVFFCVIPARKMALVLCEECASFFFKEQRDDK